MQGWERFQERAQWNAIWHNCPTSPENGQHDKTNDNQTYTHASCWKENGRNRKKECKAGNTSRREPSGMPFREISPRLEIILGVFDMLGTPGNKKGSWHNHPTSPENGQNMTKPVTTKHTHMLLAEKEMEEIERKNARLGTLPEESPVECHSVRFPPG